MQKYKNLIIALLCITIFLNLKTINVCGEEIKAYSSDYKIELFGNCIYGAVIIQDNVYIPLETFKDLDNCSNVSINKNSENYRLSIREYNYETPPTKQDTSQIPLSWVDMGSVQSDIINLTVDYQGEATTITDGFYSFKGEYPMVKLSKLQECIPIIVDYINRIITIGDSTKFVNLPIEPDLVGQVLPEIASKSWDSITNMKSIHDYLVKTLYYPKRTNYLDFYPDFSIKEEEPEVIEAKQKYYYRNNYTLAGRSAICEQYARLFRDLCRRSGIVCMNIDGYAGEMHEWNKVFVNNEWFYVDVTFDDPFASNKNSLDVRHDYFMKTSEEMYISHCWQGDDYSMPEYSEDWKDLDCNNVTSREMYYKCFVGQLAKGNKHIELKLTVPDAYGGLAFLYYYHNKGIFDIWSVSNEYKDGKYIFDVK